MSQIVKKGLQDNAVGAAKIRLENNTVLRARNAANSGDISLFKVNASDVIESAGRLEMAGFRLTNALVEPTQLASDPANATGQFYYNTTSNVFRYYNGTTWGDVGSASLPTQTGNPDKVLQTNGTVASWTWLLRDGASINSIDFSNRYLYDASGNLIARYGINDFQFDLRGGTIISLWNAGNTQATSLAAGSPSASITYTLPPADGTSGFVLSTNGSGALSWVAAGSGANVTLSNLTNPTAINQDLIFNKSNATLRGQDKTGATASELLVVKSGNAVDGITGDMTVQSGSSSGTGGTGAVLLASGDVLDGGSGTVNVATGAAASSGGSSGSSDYHTGAVALGSGNSGSMNLYSGDVVDGSSGVMIFQSGGATGTGTTGTVSITAGAATAGPDNEGLIELSAYRTDMIKGALRFFNSAADLTALAAYVAGDTYYNSTLNQIKFYNGTSWVALAAGGAVTWDKMLVTLSAGDITNQYVDLSQVALNDSITFVVKGGGPQIEGASHDYSVNYTGGGGGNTRITFLNDLATGGAAALVAGDVVVVEYQY